METEEEIMAVGQRNTGLEARSVAIPESTGATYLFAVVDQDGNLIRGQNAVSARRIVTGDYEVIFNRDVRRGAYVASIGLPGSLGVSPPGEISVVGRFTDTRGVFVATQDSNGVSSDRGFHLVVLSPEGFA